MSILIYLRMKISNYMQTIAVYPKLYKIMRWFNANVYTDSETLMNKVGYVNHYSNCAGGWNGGLFLGSCDRRQKSTLPKVVVFHDLRVEFRPPTPFKSQSSVAAALDMGLNRGFTIPPALTVPFRDLLVQWVARIRRCASCRSTYEKNYRKRVK